LSDAIEKIMISLKIYKSFNFFYFHIKKFKFSMTATILSFLIKANAFRKINSGHQVFILFNKFTIFRKNIQISGKVRCAF